MENESSSLLENATNEEKAHETFRELYPQGCESKESAVMNVKSPPLPSKTSKPSRLKSGAKQMVDDSNSQMSETSRIETPERDRNLYMDSLYQEIIHRFDGLRERMEHSGILSIVGSEHLLRRVVRQQDQSGNMLNRVEETSMVSNTGRQTSGDGSQGPCRAKCCLKHKSENLEDTSMPMLNDESSIPAMSTRVNPQRLTNSFGTNICLDDITAPSFAQDSRRGSGSPYTQQVAFESDMPCEYLDNVTMPSYAGCPEMSSAFQSAYMQDDQCSYYLEDIPMPSYTVLSVSQQQHTMPSECLENITQPSYVNSMSQTQSQQKPDFSMASLNIFDTTGPFYKNSRMMISEEVSSAPGAGTFMRQQQSMQSQNICDESAPSFGSRFEAVSVPCLQDISMPSYANVSGASEGQPTMPSEFLNNITQPSHNRRVSYGTTNDISAPLYGTNGMMTNERLENITMPSYGGVSSALVGQQTILPCGCIEDESAPSFGRRMSLNRIQKYRPSKNASRSTTPTRQQTMPSECLNDMSMPSFGGVSVASGRQQTMSTYGGESGSSRRQQTMPCECLNDKSMPSYGEVSGPSGRQQTLPSECLNDMSMPSFYGPSGPSARQQTMSTFGGASGSSRRQQTMPSECLNDMSMPSFVGVSGVPGRQQTMSTLGGVSGSSRRQQTMPSECLNDKSMPSYGEVTGLSGRQQTLPSECLNDMSMPSFYGTSGPSSMQQSMSTYGGVSGPSRRQQPMPSECLNDMSMPSFAGVSGVSGRQQTMPSECLNEISMPSFGGESGSSRRKQTMPCECLNDISMPSFGGVSGPSGRQQTMSTFGGVSGSSRRQQPMLSECLNDMTMPSFGGLSGPSGRQQTLPSECLNDISMPSFAGVSRPSGRQQTMPSECLNDISMPSFGAEFGSSRKQQTVPCECLNDISMPSFGAVSGLSGRQQTMTTFGGVSGSSRRQQHMVSECLNDMSMPSFGGVSGPSGRQQTMPSECLNDVSMPSFGGVSGSSGRQQTINGFGEVFGSSGRQQTMPTFGGVSGSSRGQQAINGFGGVSRSSRRQQPMPSECLNDVSMPSFGGVSLPSGRQQTLPSECLNDISMPSFGGVSRPSGRQQTMPSECINDMPMPSFGGGPSGRQQTMPSECLNDISMPSFGGVSGSSRRQQTMPCECINDMPMPSFGGVSGPSGRQQTMPSECLNDISMPSFGGVSGSSRRQQTMPSECINDMTMPSFGGVSGSSGRQQTMPSEYLNDMSMPSFGGVSGKQQTIPPECLENVTQPSSRPLTLDLKNITMPSFGVISGASRRQESGPGMSRSKNQKSLPTKKLNDMSMPSSGAVSDAPKARPQKKQQPTMPSQSMNTMSASSFGSHGSRNARGKTLNKHQQTMPSQDISDIPAPTFDSSSGNRTITSECRDQMTMPTICDVNESFRRMQHARSLSQGANPRPQQNSSGTRRVNMACECLANVSMPSGIPNYSFDQTMPSQYVDNVSARTFGNSIPQGLGQRQQMSGSGQKISMRRTHFNVDQYRSDVNAPNFNRTLASYHQRTIQCPDAMASEYQTNETMPAMQTESSKLRTVHSFPCLSNPQQICDISEPSIQGVNYSYPDSQNTGQYIYARQTNGDSSPANPLPHLLWGDETNFSGNIDQVTSPSMFADSRFQEQFEKSNNNQSTNLPNDGVQFSKVDQVNKSGTGNRPGNTSPGTTSTPKTSTAKKNAKSPNNPKVQSSVKGKVVISVSNTSVKKVKGKTNGTTAYKKSYQKSNTQNIDDLMMPMVESIEQSGASGPSNLNTFISQISEPSFGPSLETCSNNNDTPKSVREQRSVSRKPVEKKDLKSPKKQPR